MKMWLMQSLTATFDAGGVTEITAYKFKDKGIKFIKFSEDLPGFSVCVSKTMPQNIKDSMEHALTALDRRNT